MMSDVDKVVTEVRESFGKGAARKIRAVGKIPAVIYGHGSEPQHVTLPAHQMGLILRKTNALLNLDIAGKSELVLVKDVQKDPVRQIIEHIDLIVIRKGEKVEVEIPVHVEGEPFSGTQVDQDLHTLRLESEATNIPTSVVVNVDGLTEGAQVLAKDVVLPAGSTLVEEPNALVLSVYALAAAKAEGTEAAE
ncbi:50S ribosomal protein L25/general stress protein Ctc [Microterricola viridarii]|nr:50S ribosomal protein L25/general stress protein Ctc [Microterricola viridarii]